MHWNKELGEKYGNYILTYKNGQCHLKFPFALYDHYYTNASPIYVGEGECDLIYHEREEDYLLGYMECGPITIKQIGP